MVEIAAIFEKIKAEYGQKYQEAGEFEFCFTPVSLGFEESDFIFLDSTALANNAQKYNDELQEFSLITNNIPFLKGIWELDGNQENSLASRFPRILRDARPLDADSLTIESILDTPIFDKVLGVIRDTKTDQYLAYRSLIAQDMQELVKLGAEPSTPMGQIQLEALRNKLELLRKDWVEKGFKHEVEASVLQAVQRDSERFWRDWSELKSKFMGPALDGFGGPAYVNLSMPDVSFLPNYCSPQNLYDSKNLDWVKVDMKRDEIIALMNAADQGAYSSLFGDSEQGKIQFSRLSFELLFVTITRAWFKEDMLTKPYWDLDPLAKGELAFDQYPTKLVLVRNVEIVPLENSPINLEVISKFKHFDLAKIGPFLTNPALLGTQKKMSLMSFTPKMAHNKEVAELVRGNLALSTRMHHANIRSHLFEGDRKPAVNTNIHRRLFEESHNPEGPGSIRRKLFDEKKEPETLIVNPNLIGATRLTNPQLNFMFPYKVVIKVLDSDKQPVKGGTLEVYVDGKKLDVEITGAETGNLTFKVSKSDVYTLKFEHPDYELNEFKLEPTVSEHKQRILERQYTLLNKVEAPLETNAYSLVAVICKRMPSFPQPFPGATYL